MTERYLFEPIREKSAADPEYSDKKAVSPLPLETAEGEPGKNPSEQMMMKDHLFALRDIVQDALEGERDEEEIERERKLLSELITPELMADYREILAGFRDRLNLASDETGERHLVDVEDGETAEEIGKWVEKLLAEVNRKRAETGFDDQDLTEIEAQSWLFFSALAGEMNANIVSSDIRKLSDEANVSELLNKDLKPAKEDILRKLGKQYPDLGEDELDTLFELENRGPQPMGLVEFTQSFSRIWNEYEVGGNTPEERKATNIMMAELFTASGMEGASPALFSSFGLGPAIFAYLGIGMASEAIKTKGNIDLRRIVFRMEENMNRRIADSLVFRDFEFIHDQSATRMYDQLQRGKSSADQLISASFEFVFPSTLKLFLALGLLTKINPVLGSVGLTGLPIMYAVAKRQSRDVRIAHEKGYGASERNASWLRAVKEGMEMVKTSSNSADVADEVHRRVTDMDAVKAERSILRRKVGLKAQLPIFVSDSLMVSTGILLKSMGKVTGGDILSTLLYSNNLSQPIRRLTDLYFNEFPNLIRDIERMEELLGNPEDLDDPSGEKERHRRPLFELDNLDISVRGLSYKNILENVNLDISQGEAVRIRSKTGTGKTVLLRNILGLYQPREGTVTLGDVPIGDIRKYGDNSFYEAFAYCNQQPHIFDGMTLRENIALWSSKREIDDGKLKDILRSIGLEKFEDRLDESVSNLSGGEMVRIGIARMLAKDAKVLVLDEPTENLDEKTAAGIKSMLEKLKEADPERTIILVTHDEHVAELADRTVNLVEIQSRSS